MNREQISALMDGEAESTRVHSLCQALKDDESCECWSTYHLIGDVLRGERMVRDGFTERLAERLAAEPTVLAPGASPRAERGATRVSTWPDQVRARPWYYGMAAAAAVAAVGVVGWFGAQEFMLGPGLGEQAAVTAVPGLVPTIAVNAQASTALAGVVRRSRWIPTCSCTRNSRRPR
jgi:negative regulator of sigma E activity